MVGNETFTKAYLGEVSSDESCETLSLVSQFDYQIIIPEKVFSSSSKGLFQRDFTNQITNYYTTPASFCLPNMSEHAFKEAEENAWFNPFKQGGFIFKVDSNSGGTYVYGLTNGDGENGVDYFIWNAGFCGWQAYTQPTNDHQMRMTLYEAFFSAMLDVARENGHTALDLSLIHI